MTTISKITGKPKAKRGFAAMDRKKVSEIASRNSFQQKKKVRIAVVNTPGAAIGTITFRNACHCVAPSTCAACSDAWTGKNSRPLKISVNIVRFGARGTAIPGLC